MNYQDAIERAIGLRLRVKKEADDTRRQALLDLAKEWEAWAEICRDRASQGEAINPAHAPPDDI